MCGLLLALGPGCGSGDGARDAVANGDGAPDGDGLDPPTDAPPYGLGPVAITWSLQEQQGETPNWASFTSLHFDESSGQIISYQIRNTSGSIYATDMFAYKTTTRTWTRLGGTGSPSSMCSPGSTSDVQPWPQDRHPVRQMAIDTARDRLYLYGGVCQNDIKEDMWAYSLNADPTANRMTQVPVSSTYFHLGGRWPNNEYEGAMVYSQDDDVLFSFGYALVGGPALQNFVFCASSTLSAAQMAAGCTEPEAWSAVLADPQPTFPMFPELFYDAARRKVVHFGRLIGPNGGFEIWEYDIPSHTWTNRNPSGVPAEPEAFVPENLVSYITSGTGAGKYHYHQTSHAGTGTQAADYIYDPQLNMFAPLTSTGGGPTVITYMTFDPTAGPNGTIVAFEYGNRLWHGVLE